MSSAGRYYYPRTNRIICTLFRDASLARELGIYKPIGELVIRRFDARFRRGSPDRYNDALDDFPETERWRDPVHASLRLFGFMVSEAAYQGVTWHMWLYYVPHFVNAIERNLQPSKGVDLEREWPTPYHYFLYECFSLLWDWIGLASDIDEWRPHSTPRALDTENENDNIPKSACIALGQAWYSVAKSTRISEPFKIYLLEAVISRLNDLRGSARLDRYRLVALRSIAVGAWRTGQALVDHQRRTLIAFRSVDHVLRESIEPELHLHITI